ncbi:MAG: extracellular solute-binding protein [Alphaproteobacteria bacterium]|nr:extracellular solute-binding protein [Alphaproteobacteria bacterium]
MRFIFILSFLIFSPLTSAQAEIIKSPSIAMHGTPKYGQDFKHLNYVNPDAPKGGTLKNSAIGTFDSLNPFIIKGTPAAGLTFLGQSFIYDALMEQSYDEPFSMYGLLAETIEYDSEDKSWVAFNLRPEAKWHDGQPVTAHDVVWSFNIFMEHGSPFFKAYYGDVTKVEATSDRRVKFTFAHADNAELPLILSQMAVLPKHFWEKEKNDFTATSLEAPLGSGPYKISHVEAGRSITYERNPDYWGKDLPINKGRFNFDKIIYDYYKDSNVALEAFFAGEYDTRIENVAKLWNTGYDAAPVKNGDIIKEEIAHQRPQGLQGFLYNIRRPVFTNIKVREALSYAFDFEWSNKQFAYGGYKRTDSFFENSELAALDGPPKARVLEILNEYKDKLPQEIFESRYAPPKTDGSGNLRRNLRAAMKILDEAGYKLGKDGIRTHEKTGQRLEFEIIDSNPLFERWVLPFIANLKKIGVQTSFRVLDPAQYQNRMNDFDFDMTIGSIAQSSSPGNEQRDFWSSEKADIKGSRNYIGIQDPVIDDLIEKIIKAPSRAELVALTRALDRVLLSGYYVIPQWHIDYWRVAYWKKLGRPENLSGLTPAITDTWWVKE